MSHFDEDDLARSHELQRRMERDDEREPHRRLVPHRRPRYFARVVFRPAAAIDPTLGARRTS